MIDTNMIILAGFSGIYPRGLSLSGEKKMREIFIVCIICALFGGVIGENKSRPTEGFFAGLLLGPLGVVWIIARTAK